MNPIARAFYEDCRTWYANRRKGHNAPARVNAYRELIEKHGAGPVVRHARLVKRVLDRLEVDAQYIAQAWSIWS